MVEVELEVEGETRTIESEKLERLVEYEDSVIYDEFDVEEPNQKSFLETLTNTLPKTLTDLAPKTVTGTISDATILDDGEVEIEFVFRQQTHTEVLDLGGQKLSDLLDYCGLEVYELLELPEQSVHVSPTKRGDGKRIDVPRNTSLWARAVFSLVRGGYRFGLVAADTKSNRRTKYSITDNSAILVAILQAGIGALIGSVLYNSATVLNDSSVGSVLAFLILCLVTFSAFVGIVGVILGGILVYRKTADRFRGFTKTSYWPL